MNILQQSGLDEFVTCSHPKDRHAGKENDRFKPFPYADLVKRFPSINFLFPGTGTRTRF
jgi:hypothetical protein